LPASITTSPQTTPAKIDRRVVDPAAEPQSEHPPNFIGQEAREHEHQERLPSPRKSLIRDSATVERHKR
jgi:hypothetical protein